MKSIEAFFLNTNCVGGVEIEKESYSTNARIHDRNAENSYSLTGYLAAVPDMSVIG